MENDFLPLLGTDYIEFYVGNAKQAAHFYKTALGFQGIAYAGPETGVRDRASYVLRQNKLTFVFTSALRPDHEIARAGIPAWRCCKSHCPGSRRCRKSMEGNHEKRSGKFIWSPGY